MRVNRNGRAARPAFLSNISGGAAVEFAVLAPILALIIAAALDFGSVVYVKSRIESAVSAGANFAIVNAGKVSAGEAAGLGQSVAAYVGVSGALDEGAVVVNSGPSAVYKNGVVTTGGNAADAASCYCPTLGDAGLIVWGSPTSCGSACADGGRAGKFVTISAKRQYAPLFSNYGLVNAGAIIVETVAQTE